MGIRTVCLVEGCCTGGEVVTVERSLAHGRYSEFHMPYIAGF